jgi:lipid-A-disaccharide synthase-like uncharacterized protein
MDTLSSYLHEVFVARLDWWAALGFLAQVLFGLRFVAQWIASERVRRSVAPTSFWLFSIVGGLLLFAYSLYRKEPVFIIGQSLILAIYLRNLSFILRAGARLAEDPRHTREA